MGSKRSHRELRVWRKAIDLVEEVYRLSARFPPDERYRLTDQLNRAVLSVPANIAEGCERASDRDFARFLGIAKGSLAETETFLLIAVRLRYVRRQDVSSALAQILEIGKMLTALRAHLKREEEVSRRPH